VFVDATFGDLIAY